MEFIQSAETIVSLICGIGSVVMFLLSKKQKNECEKIKTIIDQKIEIINKASSISSNDQYHVNSVETFDNRKTIN